MGSIIAPKQTILFAFFLRKNFLFTSLHIFRPFSTADFAFANQIECTCTQCEHRCIHPKYSNWHEIYLSRERECERKRAKSRSLSKYDFGKETPSRFDEIDDEAKSVLCDCCQHFQIDVDNLSHTNAHTFISNRRRRRRCCCVPKRFTFHIETRVLHNWYNKCRETRQLYV